MGISLHSVTKLDIGEIVEYWHHDKEGNRTSVDFRVRRIHAEHKVGDGESEIEKLDLVLFARGDDAVLLTELDLDKFDREHSDPGERKPVVTVRRMHNRAAFQVTFRCGCGAGTDCMVSAV